MPPDASVPCAREGVGRFGRGRRRSIGRSSSGSLQPRRDHRHRSPDRQVGRIGGAHRCRQRLVLLPADSRSIMNADWHKSAINRAVQNVSVVAKTAAVIPALA